MALAADLFTIADAARAQGFGMTARLLEERLDLTPALPAVMCNSGDTHVGSLQTLLPETFVRRMNQGVPSSMGSKASIRLIPTPLKTAAKSTLSKSVENTLNTLMPQGEIRTLPFKCTERKRLKTTNCLWQKEWNDLLFMA